MHIFRNIRKVPSKPEVTPRQHRSIAKFKSIKLKSFFRFPSAKHSTVDDQHLPDESSPVPGADSLTIELESLSVRSHRPAHEPRSHRVEPESSGIDHEETSNKLSTDNTLFKAPENDMRHYRDLDTSSREIRYILIEPCQEDREDAELHCSLHYMSLDDPISYEALSYVWGDASETVPITLWHTTSNSHISQSFNVTTNLAAALRNFRHKSSARVVWADAICINQHNLLERNQQVSIIRQIYSMAKYVQVWLGKEDDNSRIVAKLTDVYAGEHHAGQNNSREVDVGDGPEQNRVKKEKEEPLKKQRNEERLEKTVEAGDDTKEHVVLEVLKKLTTFDTKRLVLETMTDVEDNILVVLMRALSSVVSRPWFRRIWVIQEVFCSGLGSLREDKNPQKLGPVVFLNFDKMQIRWLEFCAFSYHFFTQHATRLLSFKDSILENGFRPVCLCFATWSLMWAFSRTQKLEPDVLQLIDWTHGFKSTDLRDRVFAILGLARDTKCSSNNLILPDYTKSLAEVLMDLARWHIESSGSLRILSVLYPLTVEPPIIWIPYLFRDNRPRVFLEIDGRMPYAYLDAPRTENRRHSDNDTQAFLFTSEGSSLRVPGTRISRVKEIKKQYIFLDKDRAWICVNPGSHKNEDCEELFSWLLKTFWDPLREPSKASFLTNCLQMLGRYGEEDKFPAQMWTTGFKYYLQHVGLSETIKDSFFVSGIGRHSFKLHLENHGGKFLFHIRGNYSGSNDFLVTEEGELGMGRGSKEGDVVVALKTAKFPYVLRPCSEPNRQGKYRIVGPCLLYAQRPMNDSRYLPTDENPLEIFDLV